MTRLLERRNYFYVAIICIIYTLSIFDVSFVLGHNVYWSEPFGDRVTNIIGALYFAHDSWRWPLFYVPSLAFPEGANIVYTDSIPLFALVDKIVFKMTGQWFNYFGFWIFSCFPLVAFFMVLAIKEVRCKDWIAILGTVILVLCCPALLWRFGHASLMGHFLIAWSLFLYCKFKHKSSSSYFTTQFAIIGALSVLIQTYFLLMILPFFVAGLLQALVERRIQFRAALISFVIVIGSILLTGFVAGIIGPGSPVATMFGFGYYSMNLLSPFIPSYSHLPHFLSRYISWDANKYLWDATGGQYEGYNYLGAGILILLLINLIFSFRFFKSLFVSNFFLIVGLFCLFLLALSNKIYLGNWVLVNIHLNSNIFSYFRTSGRLFWPVYYVLVILLITMTFKRFSPQVARSIIIVAVIAQFADTQQLRENVYRVQNTGMPQALNHQIWESLLKKHKVLEQYPSFQCGGWAGDWPGNNSNMELLLMAAHQNMPSNSAYLARTSRNCIEERTNASDIQIEKGRLYTFAKNFPIQNLRDSDNFKKWCRTFKFGVVCTQQFASSPLLGAMTEFSLPSKIPIPKYKVGDVLHFVTNGNGEPFLHQGWYNAETWGTWTNQKNAEVRLETVKPQRINYKMTVYARGFVNPRHPEKVIQVYVNGVRVALWKYHLGEDVARNSVAIPNTLIPTSGILKINFVSDETESPKQAGISEDTKQISLGLMELSIVPV